MEVHTGRRIIIAGTLLFWAGVGWCGAKAFGAEQAPHAALAIPPAPTPRPMTPSCAPAKYRQFTLDGEEDTKIRFAIGSFSTRAIMAWREEHPEITDRQFRVLVCSVVERQVRNGKCYPTMQIIEHYGIWAYQPFADECRRKEADIAVIQLDWD